MKFYRTYLITFRTSTGIKYYAGKHVSKYENATDDPYRGSGRVITRAVKKYGLACIESIEWTDHTKETLNDAEIALIAECKEKYGAACTNCAKGGDGGNTLEYATEDELMKFSRERSESAKKHWDDDEWRSKMIITMKNTQSRPDIRAKNSQAVKLAKSTPSARKRTSEAAKKSWLCPKRKSRAGEIQKNAQRKSKVWNELYSQLWTLWIDLGMPKYAKFQGYCKKNGITDLSLLKLVVHFNERYEQEQLQKAA